MTELESSVQNVAVHGVVDTDDLVFVVLAIFMILVVAWVLVTAIVTERGRLVGNAALVAAAFRFDELVLSVLLVIVRLSRVLVHSDRSVFYTTCSVLGCEVRLVVIGKVSEYLLAMLLLVFPLLVVPVETLQLVVEVSRTVGQGQRGKMLLNILLSFNSHVLGALSFLGSSHVAILTVFC